MSKRSSLYETSPVENTDQPDFINCVVEIGTKLTSVKLLEKIQSVEAMLNVVPKQNKGASCIDLDILLFDNERADTQRLQLPHPAMCRRRFVLVPLLEIEPQEYCQIDKRPYRDCLANLNDPTQRVEVYHG